MAGIGAQVITGTWFLPLLIPSICLSICLSINIYLSIYLPVYLGFPDGSEDKESTCNAGDTGDSDSVPGLGRSPGVGNGNLLKLSCLENSMDRGAWQITVNGVAELDTTEHMVCVV